MRQTLCNSCSNSCSVHVSRNSVCTSPIESRSQLCHDHANVALRKTWSIVSGQIAVHCHISQCSRLHSLHIESLRVSIHLNIRPTTARSPAATELGVGRTEILESKLRNTVHLYLISFTPYHLVLITLAQMFMTDE